MASFLDKVKDGASKIGDVVPDVGDVDLPAVPDIGVPDLDLPDFDLPDLTMYPTYLISRASPKPY